MNLLNNLKWRYATKKFDPVRKISEDNLNKLLTAANLSPSSYGLQPYKIIRVTSPELRSLLREFSWNQSQITDAAEMLIFCNYTKFGTSEIDEYLNLTCEIRNQSFDTIKGYGDFMTEKLGEKSELEMFRWSSNQAYLALANLISASAELKIDSCPMEGFDSTKYNEILGLTSRHLNSLVVVTLGYRHSSDSTQHLSKVRKPLSTLVESV